jgi:sugar lactone lactonase YvrE
MPTTSVAELLYHPVEESLRFLPEGPYPIDEDSFSWVAIQHGPDGLNGSLNIYRHGEQSNDTHILPGRPGFAFRCDRPHTFVVGCERQLGIYHSDTGQWTAFCRDIDAGVDNTIINDAVVWQDNLIFGCKDLQFKTPKAGLYLWRGRDQQLITLRRDQVCSNGKAVRETPRGLQLIDIDSPTRRIVGYALDLERGTLGPPTTLIDLTSDPGVPDGLVLTPDAQGVIVSIYLPERAPAGQTRWYDLANGELIHVWETPDSPRNTCPQLLLLGGRTRLVITTAVENMPADQRPYAQNAGCLFSADVPFDSPGDAPAFPLAAAGPTDAG